MVEGRGGKAAYEAVREHLQRLRDTAAGRAEEDEWWRGRAAREEGKGGEDGGWGVTRVEAARRTADCLGGWEYKVRWEAGGATWEPAWSLLYRRAGWIRQQCDEAKRTKVMPSSLYGRLTGEGGYIGPEEEAREPCRGAGRASGLRWRADGKGRPEGGRERVGKGLSDRLAKGLTLTEGEWRAVGVEDLRVDDYIWVEGVCCRPVEEERRAWVRVQGMSAAAVEEAVRGDMERESAKRAGRKLWGQLLRHARGGAVGGDAEDENCGEDAAAGKAAATQWGQGRHWEWCTYYPGGEEQRRGADGEMESKARAGLEKGREGEREGVTRWVTESMARERSAEQAASEAGAPQTYPDCNTAFNTGLPV